MSIIEKAIDLKKAKGPRDKAAAPETPAAQPSAAQSPAVDEGSTPARKVAPAPAGHDRAEPAAPEPRAGSRTVPINLKRLASMGIALASDSEACPDPQARTRTREEFRLIKRPLLLNAFGQGADAAPGGNVVMVTSAVAGEGKTFCSVSIAMSIAMERDRRVLLVDADLQRPRIAQVLGVPGGPGLTDLLENPSLELSDVLLKTDVSRLSVLPAGSRHQYGTELLASDAMKNLVLELSERYPDRIVLFDSPPLLAATQAVVLAGLAGQIVVVVGAGSTSQEAVSEALALVDAQKPVGLVLNRYPRMFQPEYYYG